MAASESYLELALSRLRQPEMVEAELVFPTFLDQMQIGFSPSLGTLLVRSLRLIVEPILDWQCSRFGSPLGAEYPTRWPCARKKAAGVTGRGAFPVNVDGSCELASSPLIIALWSSPVAWFADRGNVPPLVRCGRLLVCYAVV